MKATVATPAPRMAELEKKRELVHALMGGTAAMVEAGKKWLPQHPGESDGNYGVRLKGNVLTNFLSRAVNKSATRIMSKPITLTDIPPELEAMLDDVDLQGRDLNAFALDLMRQGFEGGITYILVDKPQFEKGKTLAEAKQAGIRPYAIHVKPSALLEALGETVNGVQTLTRVRIMETVQEQDGYEYASKERVRELLRVVVDGMPQVIYRLHEERETAQGAKKEWVVVEEGTTAMQRIALVPVYVNRVGYMEGEPPHQDTAELNLDHWRVKSEQRNALTMNCFEMLAATGVGEDWSPEVGPAKVQRSDNEQAKFYYLSPSGSGVTLAENYLKTIEAQVETAQATLRVENGGRVSATAAAIDSEEGSAGLKAVAEAFSDSLELMLSYFAEMQGVTLPTTAAVGVNTDMGVKKGTDAGLQELTKARALGDISRSGYLSVLQWRGELPPTFDIDADADLAAQETPLEPQVQPQGGKTE